MKTNVEPTPQTASDSIVVENHLPPMQLMALDYVRQIGELAEEIAEHLGECGHMHPTSAHNVIYYLNRAHGNLLNARNQSVDDETWDDDEDDEVSC